MAYVRLKNVKAFNTALSALIANGKKTVEKSMTQQAKLLTRNLMRFTPPSRRGGGGKQAHKAGMQTVNAHIRKVIMGVDARVDPNPGLTMRDLHKHHKKSRTNGQIKGKARKPTKGKARVGKGVLITSKSKVNAYVKKQKQSVGMLAAGWNAAAKKFGLGSRQWPAWVRKHSPPSAAKFTMTKNQVKIRLTNRVKYSGNVGVMARALDWALERQAWNINKIMHDWKRTAASNNFKVK